MLNPFREKRLFRRLRRGSRASRLMAAREIGREGSFAYLPKLIEMVPMPEGGVDEGPYVAARLILSRFPVPELCRRLTDKRIPASVRLAMLQEIRTREERRAAKLLIPVMLGAEEEIRFRASHVMGSVGDGSTVPFLTKALAQDDPLSREAAALALGLIASPKAIGSLIPLLGDAEPRVAFTTALSLGLIARENGARAREAWYEEVGGREPIAWLIAASRSKEAALRAMACFTLGEIGVDRETVVESILDRLRDADPVVRQWAGCACGQLGTRDAVEKLRALTRDSRSGPRAAAAQALGVLSDRSAAPELLHLLTDRKNRVRKEAEQALSRMTYHVYDVSAKEAEPPVMHWRQWWQRNGAATRDVWLKKRVAAEIVALESPKLFRRSRAIEFLNEKTKQRHEFVPDGPRNERSEAVRTWKAWWHRNAPKHPVEWLIEVLRSASEHRRQAAYLELKRVTKGLFVYDAYASIARRNEALRNIEAWWDKNRKIFVDSDAPL